MFQNIIKNNVCFKHFKFYHFFPNIQYVYLNRYMDVCFDTAIMLVLSIFNIVWYQIKNENQTKLIKFL